MTRRTKKKKKRTIINGISRLWIKSLDGPKDGRKRWEEKLKKNEGKGEDVSGL